MSKLAASWFGRSTFGSPPRRRGYLTLYSYSGPRRRRKSGIGRAVALGLGAVAIGVALAVVFNLLGRGLLGIG